jgi:hypothetical protein
MNEVEGEEDGREEENDGKEEKNRRGEEEKSIVYNNSICII